MKVDTSWQLVDHIAAPVIVLGQEAVIAHVNPSALEMLGLESTEVLVGSDFLSLLPPDQIPDFETFITDLAKHPAPLNVDLQSPSGITLPVLLSGEGLPDQGGMGSYQVITLLERAALVESRGFAGTSAADLEWLADQGRTLLTLETWDETLEFAAQSLQRKLGDCLVIPLSLYDEDTLQLEGIYGIENRLIDRAWKFIGGQYHHRLFAIDVRFKDTYYTRSLYKHPVGLEDFAISQVPANISRKLIETVGIEDIYTIGLEGRRELVGCFYIFTLTPGKKLLADLVESYVFQVALALEKSRIKEDLEQSENRFETFFEYAPDGYYISDLKGNFITGNKVAERITGFDRSELVGKNFLKAGLVSHDQLPKASKLLALNVLGKSTGPDEFVLTRKDSSQLPVEISTFPVKIDDKPVVLGIARDISLRKKNEEKLVAAHQSLTKVLEGMDAHVYVADFENYEILYMNKRMIQDFGGDFTGKTCYQVFRDQKERCVDCNLDRLLDPQGLPGEVVVWESQNPKTGRWYKNYDRVIHWTDQRLAKMQIAVDITENIQASKALEASENRYRNLFENSHSALMTLAPPDWAFGSGNAAILELFKVGSEEQFKELMPWDLSPEFQPDGQLSKDKAIKMIQIAVEEESHFFHWTHKKLTGEEFQTTVHLSRVNLEEEFIIQAAVRDISDRIQAEKIMSRQMDELALINNLNSLANEGKGIQEILAAFGAGTKELFNAINAHVYLLDSDKNQLNVELISPDQGLRQGISELLGIAVPERMCIWLEEDSLFQELITQGEAQILTGRGQIQQLMREMALGLPLQKGHKKQLTALMAALTERAGIDSIAVVPMLSEGTIIGLVDLVLPHRMSELELDVLRSSTEQLSVIVRRILAEAERRAHLTENQFISQSLAESTRTEDIDQLCTRLAENVSGVNPDAYVMISLYDPAVNAIRLRALKGLGKLADRLTHFLGRKPEDIQIDVAENPLDEDLNQRFTSGKLEKVPGGLFDLTRGVLPRKICQTLERIAGVGEIYIAGFGLRGKSTGGLVLMVKEGKEIQFPSAIETITSHYAVIFERRIAQDEVLLRKAQLEALRNVELEIASQLDQEKLLQTIAEEARSIVNAAACGFSIVNPDRDVLEYLAYTGLDDLPENTDILRGEGLSGKVWETGETMLVENYAQWEGHSSNWQIVGDYNLVGIPVIWGDEFLGVLEIATDLEDRISPTAINTLELFATQAAIAVKNARLYKEEMVRRQEAETLREVGLLINRMMDRGDLMDMILSALKRVVPYHGASVQLVQGNAIVVEAYQGIKKPDVVVGTQFLINDNPIAQNVLYGGKKVVLSSADQVGELLQGPNKEDVQSWMAVPLEVKGNRIGIITLDHSRPNQYSEQDVNLVMDFATQAAIALENNRLFDQIRRRTREIEVVYESAMQLTRELHPDLLFENLRKQIVSMFEQDAFLLATFNENTRNIEIVYASEDGIQQSHTDGLHIPLDVKNSLLSWIVRKRTPLMIGNVETESLPVHPVQRGKTIRSWLGVPLLAGKRVIGALAVQSFQADAYTHEDQRLLELLGNQAAVALENSRLFEDAQRRLSRLSSLREIDMAISGSVDLEMTMEVLISQLINSLDVDAACVLAYHPHQHTLNYVSGKGFQTKSLQHTSLKIGEGLAGLAAKERSLVQIPDLSEQQTSLDRSPMLKKENFVTYLAHPLIAKGELVGVLEVFHRERLDPDPEWINFLDALARAAGIAIDRLNLFNDLSRSNFELQQAYDATIEGWARAIEMRDNSTSEHSRRVVALAMNLARKLGVKGEGLTHLRRGALLHDIGKMAIPDGILLKSGKLTDEEWHLMKKHPQYAFDMLSNIDYLVPALDIPYCHHERWDGTGYPQELAGKEIPLAARIFAVVDVWDALQSDRSYRDAWPEEKAVEYLKEQSGKHFDPEIVDAFLDLIGKS